MRLLNTKTLEQEFFMDNSVPKYAILSHTWDAEEVILQDYERGLMYAKSLKGWEKVSGSCAQAAELGYEYIWIDSCCIDKTSSAELSEAINSMYAWYEAAEICIAYLADAETGNTITSSRWFTRGWTLQELIAPRAIRFYGAAWRYLGTRHTLAIFIGQATQIPMKILHPSNDLVTQRRKELANVSVAQKMSWTAARKTTRAEDWAYSLMGIFDINMPLLYGEGQVRAFRRLQEEIIKSTDDETIYAWRLDLKTPAQPQKQAQSQEEPKQQHYWGILADTPAAFGNFGDLIPVRPRFLGRKSDHTTSITNRGVHVEFALTPFPTDKSGSIFLAFLNCEVKRTHSATTLTPAILLQKTSWDSDTEFVRICPNITALFMMNKIAMPESLSKLMQDENKRDAPMQEPATRRIFIPRDLLASRSPSGFIFVPEISDSRSQPFDLEVLARSPTWQLFSDGDDVHKVRKPEEKNEAYVIAFDVNPAPEVEDLHEAKVFGSVNLLFSTGKGWNSWVKCITVGLEPLEENPFKTPPLYYAPFFGFQAKENVEAASFGDVLDRKKRETEAKMGAVVKASIELERRFNWLAYRIRLRAEPEVSKRW